MGKGISCSSTGVVCIRIMENQLIIFFFIIQSQAIFDLHVCLIWSLLDYAKGGDSSGIEALIWKAIPLCYVGNLV
jgi:hypothetical protein